MMRAILIKVRDLKEYECIDAIDSIEMDRINYLCSLEEWNRGAIDCELKAEAKRKIEAITRKLYSFPNNTIEDK